MTWPPAGHQTTLQTVTQGHINRPLFGKNDFQANSSQQPGSVPADSVPDLSALSLSMVHLHSRVSSALFYSILPNLVGDFWNEHGPRASPAYPQGLSSQEMVRWWRVSLTDSHPWRPQLSQFPLFTSTDVTVTYIYIGSNLEHYIIVHTYIILIHLRIWREKQKNGSSFQTNWKEHDKKFVN